MLRSRQHVSRHRPLLLWCPILAGDARSRTTGRWSIPWAASVQDDQLHLATHGVRFPYRLEKWISFSSASTLHIAYRLTNLSAYAFDFIWAAHPMFVLEKGATLALPTGIGKVVTAFSASGRLGGYGGEACVAAGDLGRWHATRSPADWPQAHTGTPRSITSKADSRPAGASSPIPE